MTLYKLLLMAICLAFSGLYIIKYQQPNQADKNSKKELLFSDLDIDKISRISLNSKNSYWTLIRNSHNSSWSLENFNPSDTDQSLISNLVKSISQLSSNSFVEEDNDPAFGLIFPEFTLSIDIDNRNLKVFFGKINPLSGNRFCKLEGKSGVLLINDKTLSLLRYKGEDLREHLPFRNLEKNLISQIDFKYLIQRGKVASGILDLQQIDRLIPKITSLSVLTYLDSNPNLELKAELELNVFFKNSFPPLSLSIFSKIPGNDSGETAPRYAFYKKNNQKPVFILISNDTFNAFMQDINQ